MTTLAALPKVHEDDGKALMADIKARMTAAGFKVANYQGEVRGIVRNTDGWVGFAITLDRVPVFGKPSDKQKAGLKRYFGHAPKGTMWLTSAPDPTKMVFHVAFHGQSVGVTYETRGESEWAPKNTKPAEKKLKALFEGLGFTVVGIHENGYCYDPGDDLLNYKIVTDRPADLF